MHGKLLDIKNKIIKSINILNPLSSFDRFQLQNINDFKNMNSIEVNGDCQKLLKVYECFREIEARSIKSRIENDTYLIPKKILFYDKYLTVLSKPAQEFILNQKLFFDNLIDRWPSDDHPLEIDDLRQIAKELIEFSKEKSDPVFLRTEVLNAIQTAYHPDTGINHEIKIYTELMPVAKMAMSVNDFDYSVLRKAALLHDIGKIILSKKIVLDNTKKKEDMTDMERDIFFEEQRKHPEYGEKIMKLFCLPVSLIELVTIAKLTSIVSRHHENLQGTGYPKKETALSRNVQIMAVLDIFNSRVEPRIYKEAEALDIIIDDLNKDILIKKLFSLELEKLVTSLKNKFSN